MAASAIGAGASIAAGNAQSKAIRGAAAAQERSAQEQIALQREARENAEKELRPYAAEGDGARRMYNAAYGVAPTGEGDSLTAARGDFDAGFNASPFWETAQQSTAQALQALRATNAAAGRGTAINSGKALRAASDIANTYRGGAVSQYLSGLGGISDRGYNASTGIASGGQQFANNASTIMGQAAANSANLTVQAANAQAQGWGNAAGFIGWGAGQLSGGGMSRSFMPQGSMSASYMPYAPSAPALSTVNPLAARF